METTMTRSLNPSGEDNVDSTPLLANSNGNRDDDSNRKLGGGRWPSLRGAARFLRRASSRRIMKEPSMLVRETEAEQLEERQSDWAYSRPVVFLDIIWNLAFVIVAISVLISSRKEPPSMPLGLWIVGYGLQCVLHMVFVCMEYGRRHPPGGLESNRNGSSRIVRNETSWNLSSSSREEMGDDQNHAEESNTSVAKHLESTNTMFSFVWWIIGFYWVSAGGQELTRDSPQLYWLSIVFLPFDVFFIVFCVALAYVIGIAIYCCLPCNIAILYAVTEQEGASKEDIDQLSKYRFRKIGDPNIGDPDKLNGDVQILVGGTVTDCDTDTPIERALSAEDTECCICLSDYDDGVELRELPRSHHFHCACIDKWLYMNATCPLCKYNILKNGSGRDQV